MAAGNRLQYNRLLVHPNKDDAQNEMCYEVTPAVRDLCRSLDGFVFVIDTMQDAETGVFFVLDKVN